AGAGTCPPADMRALRDAAFSATRSSALSAADSATRASAFSAFSAFSATRSSALSAASSASSARSAASSALSAAFSATNTDRDHVGRWPALWPNQDMPQGLTKGWSLLRDRLAAEPEVWQFWIDWYEGLLTGNPMPWPLLYRIAQEITDDEWNEGPSTVARRIDDIRRDFRTSVTPRLVLLKNGLWDVEQDVKAAPEPIDFAIGQVDVALSAALGADHGNGLKETSGETILIRKACIDFKTSPSVVATSFWNACMGLQRNIGTVYPDDASLIALKNTLYTSVEELCDQDPLIRERIAKLASLETRRMPTQQERDDLQQVPNKVANELTPAALEQLTAIIDAIAVTEKPPRIWRARLVNWLNTLGNGLDRAQKNEKRATWLLKLAGRIAGWFFDP
ncbi:hypothetical protein, partial [Roseobacter sp.]|uniref:hypothetical protein n=1 Tax=Roseobacter sp. TaxID=1907202 RepID=UPI0032974CB6